MSGINSTWFQMGDHPTCRSASQHHYHSAIGISHRQSGPQAGWFFAQDTEPTASLSYILQRPPKPTPRHHCTILHEWLQLACIERSPIKKTSSTHIMDMLWEKFQWILPLYMKPICFQSKAAVVCSVTTAEFIDFCLKKLNVFSIGQKANEYLNTVEQIPGNWNVDQVLITSWDITLWCSINLLWKELMERMSEHTGLISSYQLLITAACTNTGGKMKGSRHRAADRCPFVHRHS